MTRSGQASLRLPTNLPNNSIIYHNQILINTFALMLIKCIFVVEAKTDTIFIDISCFE